MVDENMMSEKPKSNVGMMVLLVILVAIVFGGIGYWLGGNNKTTSSTATASATATSTAVATVSPKASATADETANWKTYTNDTYGFSFKYPASWTFTKGGGNDCQSIGYLTSPETKKEYDELVAQGVEGGLPITLSDISFSYCDNVEAADGNNPKKWTSFSDMVNDPSYYREQEEITFAGQTAYSVIEGGMMDYYTILMERDGHIYSIGFGNREEKSKLSSTENKILSTFQFTPVK